MKSPNFLALAVVVLGFGTCWGGLPTANLVLKAQDENGKPVDGASVTVFFKDSQTRKDTPMTGLTDKNGILTAEGAGDPFLGANVNKEGYYLGGFPIPHFRDAKDGKWQPWGATYTAIIRKVENPIPMYVSWSDIEIPTTNKACGYDLEAGDWTAPYGSGTVADFMFTLKRSFTNNRDFEISVAMEFSNPKDGIQQAILPPEGANSVFKWPRMAPTSGYEPTHFLQLRKSPTEPYSGEEPQDNAYFFRVRTEERDGRIVRALYGKIYGGMSLELGRSQTCWVRIQYYLNPGNLDQNMEWDRSRNLLPQKRSLRYRPPNLP